MAQSYLLVELWPGQVWAILNKWADTSESSQMRLAKPNQANFVGVVGYMRKFSYPVDYRKHMVQTIWLV